LPSTFKSTKTTFPIVGKHEKGAVQERVLGLLPAGDSPGRNFSLANTEYKTS
jgi:hypothetical protein